MMNHLVKLKEKGIDAVIDALKDQLSTELKKYVINPGKIMESIKLEEKSMNKVTGIIDLIKLNEDGGISKLLNEFIVHLAPKSQIDHINHITKLVVSEIMKMENTAFKFSVILGTPPKYNIDFVNVVTFNNDNYSINIANIFKGIDVDTIIDSVVEYVSQIENLDDTAKKLINELLHDKDFKTRLTKFKEWFVSESVEIKGSVKTIYRDIEEAINIMKQNPDNKTGGMGLGFGSLSEKISKRFPEVGKILKNTSERQQHANGLTAGDNSNQTGLTSPNDDATRGGAGPYTFTVTGEKLSDDKIAELNGKICTMISDSLNSKLYGFQDDLTKVTDRMLEYAEKELLEKMEIHFIKGLEQKLTKIEDEIVNSVESEKLIEEIIFGLGLKFDDALAANQDSDMINSYARYKAFIRREEAADAVEKPTEEVTTGNHDDNNTGSGSGSDEEEEEESVEESEEEDTTGNPDDNNTGSGSEEPKPKPKPKGAEEPKPKAKQTKKAKQAKKEEEAKKAKQAKKEVGPEEEESGEESGEEEPKKAKQKKAEEERVYRGVDEEREAMMAQYYERQQAEKDKKKMKDKDKQNERKILPVDHENDEDGEEDFLDEFNQGLNRLGGGGIRRGGRGRKTKRKNKTKRKKQNKTKRKRT